jgi:hypothetical protein
VDIPLSKSDYFRGVAKEAQIRTRNRYFEQNPILNDGNFAMISRPALRRWLYVGNGPIRAVYSQPGTFDNDLFVVSDDSWYRVSKTGVITLLQAGLQPTGSISMAGTANIGVTPEFMFMSDGRNLYCYIENGFAIGTISGSPANNDVVRVGSIYYKFTTGSRKRRHAARDARESLSRGVGRHPDTFVDQSRCCLQREWNGRDAIQHSTYRSEPGYSGHRDFSDPDNGPGNRGWNSRQRCRDDRNRRIDRMDGGHAHRRRRSDRDHG